MDMKQEAERIYQSDMDIEQKIDALQQLALDCQNELDAQSQNMHPEIQHQLSEGLRLANIYLRELKSD